MELLVMEIYRWARGLAISAGTIFFLTGCHLGDRLGRSEDWTDVERHNCGGFTQRGSGYMQEGDKAYISGQVRTCYNNKIAKYAKVLLINSRGDTVINVRADKRGKFCAQLPDAIFDGKIVAESSGSNLTIDDMYLSDYRHNNFDIKMRSYFMLIQSDFSPKHRRKIRKELNKMEKEKKREERKSAK